MLNGLLRQPIVVPDQSLRVVRRIFCFFHCDVRTILLASFVNSIENRNSPGRHRMPLEYFA